MGRSWDECEANAELLGGGNYSFRKRNVLGKTELADARIGGRAWRGCDRERWHRSCAAERQSNSSPD